MWPVQKQPEGYILISYQMWPQVDAIQFFFKHVVVTAWPNPSIKTTPFIFRGNIHHIPQADHTSIFINGVRPFIENKWVTGVKFHPYKWSFFTVLITGDGAHFLSFDQRSKDPLTFCHPCSSRICFPRISPWGPRQSAKLLLWGEAHENSKELGKVSFHPHHKHV